jgi:hypothetical protein
LRKYKNFRFERFAESAKKFFAFRFDVVAALRLTASRRWLLYPSLSVLFAENLEIFVIMYLNICFAQMNAIWQEKRLSTSAAALDRYCVSEWNCFNFLHI